MRVHRFFIKKSLSGDEIRLLEEEVIHQMRDVFRLKKGDTVRLLDNSGFEFESVIQLLTRDEAVFHIKSKLESGFTPKTHLHLIAAMTKRTFELVLEKGTELGVSEFTPLISERTEKQNINGDRAERIIQESAEQSGKTLLPILHEPTSLDDVLVDSRDGLIVFDFNGRPFSEFKHESQKKVSVLIGPEGGWSEQERALFIKAGIPSYSLGQQILRAETAAIAAATLLLL